MDYQKKLRGILPLVNEARMGFKLNQTCAAEVRSKNWSLLSEDVESMFLVPFFHHHFEPDPSSDVWWSGGLVVFRVE